MAHPRRWEVAATFAFALIVAWPYLSPNQYVTGFDTVTYMGPNQAFTSRALRSGDLPVWNDTLFNGVSHIANLQNAVFYPVRWMFVWAEPARALDLMSALHVFVFTAGMLVLLAARLRLRPPAAFVGTVAAVGSGLMMARLVQFEQMSVLAWLPWVLAATDWLAEPDHLRPRALGLAAAALAMPLVAGHPQETFMLAVLTGVWVVARTADRVLADGQSSAGARVRGALRRLLRVVAAGVLAFGLAAPQLLVTTGQLGQSAIAEGRALEATTKPEYSLDPTRIAAVLVGTPASNNPMVISGSEESAGAMGLVVVMLAFTGVGVAVCSSRIRATGAGLATIAAGSILLSIGPRCASVDGALTSCGTSGLVFRKAFDWVPMFSQSRVPGRWTTIAVVAIAILGAVGIDAVARGAVDRRVLAVAGSLTGAALITVVLTPSQRSENYPSTLLWWSLAALVAAGAIVIAYRLPEPANAATRSVTLAAVAVAAVLALELGIPQAHSGPRWLLTDRPFTELTSPAGEFVRDHGGRFLAITGEPVKDLPELGRAERPNANATIGARSIDGYDGGIWVTKPWVAAVGTMTHTSPFDKDRTLAMQLRLPTDTGLLARFGVRYLIVNGELGARAYGIPGADTADGWRRGGEALATGWTGPVFTDGPYQVWENPSAAAEGRIYFDTTTADTSAGLVPWAAEVAHLGTSTASVDAPGLAFACSAECLPEPVVLERPSPGTIRATVDSARPGLLVVAEQNAPGWYVSVDGGGAAVPATADVMDMAVAAQPGRHTYEFTYRPPRLRLGLATGAISLCTCALLVAWPWLRRRRQDERGG